MYKEEKIKKIRKVLKDKLCKYKGKELLKIEKDILEDILFDKISYETENNKKINIKMRLLKKYTKITINYISSLFALV